MLEICLFSLLWTVDPIAFDRSPKVAARPIATCIRPKANLIEADLSHAPATPFVVKPTEIEARLQNWEVATRDAPAWNRSRREEFRRNIHQEFNEHTVVAAERLIGQVTAGRLTEAFQWEILERNDSRITLQAVPRDKTEQLFYRSFRVDLNVETGLPDQIVAVGRNQGIQTIWQMERSSNNVGIVLVKFEDEVPPAPSIVSRTASARVD